MNKKSVDRYVEHRPPRSTVNAPRSHAISSCLKQLFTNMIPLMSINLLLLFDNLNSATPCKIKTRHKTERSVLHTGCLDCAKKERNNAGALIFALFISDDSIFY